jgi:hypothetical protein
MTRPRGAFAVGVVLALVACKGMRRISAAMGPRLSRFPANVVITADG